MTTLIQYLNAHGLPATANTDGTITTLNEYIAPDKTFHADPITIKGNWQAVRAFLRY
jgi:hypothetical protein